ncbi:DUF349 domain-containing protein, partial [Reichenbachiella sp. MALMAid0571]|uniref:DUF349 domain-containing protein n=1 Tax=Reichenbachiella sp. MALMAid0571 TaxID=3143939 RepID=UPI0032DF5147
SAEVESAEVESAEVESAEVESAEVESAEVESAEVESAEVESAEVEEENQTDSTEKTAEKQAQLEALQQIEQAGFSTMTKEELLDSITEIANKYSITIQGKVLGSLKDAFDVFYNKEKEEALIRFVDTGGEKEYFDFKGDEITTKFNEYFNLIRNNRHKHFKELEKERENNLKLKNDLLEKLREIVDSEESTASINALKQIQTEWKSIGQVPAQQNRTLWANYHALIDRFYDHRSIYFELKELDRKKNYEAKLEICQKAEELDELENFKDAIQKLNELHDEFKHIGPIPKEFQDEVWDRFKTASDLIYSKRKEFVSQIKDEQKENLIKKLELVEAISTFVEFTSDKIGDWNAKTKEMLDIQKQWEKIGAMPRENAKEINRQFWGSFKSFFLNKSEFFKKLDAQREDNLKLKQELTAQAEALIDSTDWHATAETLKGLQQKWKEIGPVPEKFRNSAYKAFKNACDSFFNNRRKHNQSMDSEYIINLKKKEEICLSLEQMANSNEVNMEDVYSLQDAYNEIGFVPRKNIKSIQNRYQDALNKLVKNAENLDKESKSEFKSLINIHELKSGPNSDQKLNRKEYSLKKKISTLESDISTWKNNIEFFAASKNADDLLKNFTTKIENAENELQTLKEELKLIMSM